MPIEPEKRALPVPEDTGATEGQEVPPPGRVALVSTSAEALAAGSHVGAALSENIETRSPTLMAVAVAALQDAHESREIVKNELEATRSDAERHRERYHAADKRVAVLEGQAPLVARLRRFQTWAFAVGGILAGSGLGAWLQAGHISPYQALLLAAGMCVMWLGSPIFRSGGE